VGFFRHDKVVDFTKSPCKKMSKKEKEGLGIGGLNINDTESDNDKSSHEALDKTPDDDEGPYMCRRVDTKSPTHKRSEEPRYQFTAAETLEIAIYQCRGDLKNFNERYDVEEKIYECDWQTKLRKRFQGNLKRTKECFEKYLATQESKKEIARETLRKEYLRAMEAQNMPQRS